MLNSVARIRWVRFILFGTVFMVIPFVSLADVKPFCAQLFLSQNETPLYFSSTIFSPIVNVDGVSTVANSKLLIEERDPFSGANTTVLRWEQRARSNFDVGFLPSPADYEMARLVKGFGGGLSAFVEGYGNRATPQDKLDVINSDRAQFQGFIDSHRLGYAIVNSPRRKPGDAFSGFIRVFDGTDYAKLLGPLYLKSKSPMQVPTERSMEKAGIKTDYFTNYRDQGYQIFQIGKYVISRNLSPKEKAQARKELMQWLLENYLDPARLLTEKVIFVFNVDRPALIETYGKEFGAKVVDAKLFDPPLRPPNTMMEVDLATLRIRLEEIVNEAAPL